MKSSDIIILVVWLPKYAVVRFQSILDGEDGLATLRCMNKTSGEQELWTTKAQIDELRQWLAGMPPELEVEIMRKYVWHGSVN